MSAVRPEFVVLHVEDDAQLAAGLARLLRAQGLEALTASDGPDALTRIAHGALPDVLIMDVNLPGEMDGADAAQEICHALGHVVPTIFLSGQLSNVGLPWLPGAPLLFVAKPVDPEVLLKAVESFADLGRFIRAHTHH
ncbi:MAG TPA: response regulator [Steroidobacteraceae bacterium]|nr:response regulator [Gammaproteobacteria bacterium]HEV2285577.1 response regulator [Steroidobacteraceae bacterium]